MPINWNTNQIELVLTSKEHFEDNLDKYINNETIFDDWKLILVKNVLQRVDSYKFYSDR